jgi:hypothetical protein
MDAVPGEHPRRAVVQLDREPDRPLAVWHAQDPAERRLETHMLGRALELLEGRRQRGWRR